MKFSPDSRWSIVYGSWPTVRVWDTWSGQEVTRNAGHDGAIRSTALSADGHTLVSLDESDSIFVWNLATGRLLRELPGTGMQVLAIALSSDGRHLAALETLDHWVEAITVWEVASGKVVARTARQYNVRMHPSGGPVLDRVQFTARGTLRASGFQDGKAAAWTLHFGSGYRGRVGIAR
jgi:WD40 repeat protein